jgi:hypothetical protein
MLEPGVPPLGSRLAGVVLGLVSHPFCRRVQATLGIVPKELEIRRTTKNVNFYFLG